MPIYEYVCGKCGKKTEVIQRVNEAKLKVCPHCGGPLKKAFSAPAIQFKGSGWYVNDYARAKQESGKSAKAEDGGGEKTEEKADTKSDSDKAAKRGDSEKPAKGEKAAGKTDKKKT
jgi:putative FmdB family regulatory protein